MKGHRKVGIAALIEALEGADELVELCGVSDPCGDDLFKARSELATAVSEKFGEQRLPISEVMRYAGIGHPDSGSHSANLHRRRASLGE
ncbi:hypothetical protein APR12_003219 [Nocardia amikacinitolerans]|nr:hypothetical protein [Nocardia amikacinitolerans]MCP2317866.1 hypothetical protein [Nocardia amikacinitolerans]